ncbi:MAG: tRNA 2-thiouridine(34) synthase MnmA [Desulfovibrio sp.]|jgi:tRNA-specific 2-thiouridylase|nr:tRNA 2-thiouridine(34) synthase MnmA [Desulfovibrio sp.]
MSRALRSRRERVLVGLSGGVDSAVAAVLLLEQGYQVIGVTMSVYDGPAAPSRGSACYDCGEAEDIAAASALAGQLGIAFHVFDCAGPYRETVIAYFRRTYLSGETPNPCVRCNPLLKFGLLPALAREKGLEHEYFATGHYARTRLSRRFGRHVLCRGRDERKDQSYFLYRLSREQLARALFPLGDLTKEDVRGLAASKGLPMRDTPDSQDFYAGEYAELLAVPDRPGDIVDETGAVLGRHAGFWHFTPGQRRGLGISSAFPLYVLRVDAARNQVVAGPYARTLRPGCLVGDLCLHVPPEEVEGELRARVRSSQTPVPVTVRHGPDPDLLMVDFAAPQPGIAPGQSLVLYQGDLVVGGGLIRAGRVGH